MAGVTFENASLIFDAVQRSTEFRINETISCVEQLYPQESRPSVKDLTEGLLKLTEIYGRLVASFKLKKTPERLEKAKVHFSEYEKAVGLVKGLDVRFFNLYVYVLDQESRGLAEFARDVAAPAIERRAAEKDSYEQLRSKMKQVQSLLRGAV